MPRVYTPKAIDMAGQVFGRLTVVSHAGHNGNGIAIWLCKCTCGKDHKTTRRNLLHPKSPTTSCGCLRNERAAENGRARRKPVATPPQET